MKPPVLPKARQQPDRLVIGVVVAMVVLLLLLGLARKSIPAMTTPPPLGDSWESPPPELAREEEQEEPPAIAARPNTDIPQWYDAQTKYLLFQPSGGISNQRKILTWALRACQVLDRTCILPHVAPHTTWYYKYNAVPLSDLASADLVYDVSSITATKIAVLTHATMYSFALGHENKLGGTWKVVERNSLREKRANPWSATDLTRMFGSAGEQFLYMAKGTMWQCFNFTADELDAVQKQVYFHPTLRTTARMLASKVAPGGAKYNALHIRFADGEANKVRENWLKPSTSFLFRMRMAKFHDISPFLYIATVPSKIQHAYFKVIKEMYNVTFSVNLPTNDLTPVVDAFPEAMRSTILGIVEQLICVRAQKFLGTGFSTFVGFCCVADKLTYTHAVGAHSHHASIQASGKRSTGGGYRARTRFSFPKDSLLDGVKTLLMRMMTQCVLAMHASFSHTRIAAARAHPPTHTHTG
jgi:hypothetical protein